MKRYLTSAIALSFWLSAHSAPEVLSTLFCQDTVFAHMQEDGKLYLLWRTGVNTTGESLLRTTGTRLDVLEELNPILRFRNIEPCDLIMSPLPRQRLHHAPLAGGTRVYYQVKPGETIFGIARRLFDLPVETLLWMNETTDYSLRIGQLLTIGWLDQNPASDSPDDLALTTQDADDMESRYILTPETLEIMPASVYTSQKGVAWWNKSKPDPNLFALHRNAPLNSYIELRNPMFNRTVQAKVIGTIPPTYSDDIAVIVSQGVARSLGAIDGRFYVEMRYEVR